MYFKILVVRLFSLCSILGMVCNCCCASNIERATNRAIDRFEEHIYQARIDRELFRGPILVQETHSDFLFQWESTVPTPGATVFEVSVPKSPTGKIGLRSKGKRPHYGYLWQTSQFPLDEAMLTNLFDLPPTPRVTNERTKRLRDVILTPREREDIANFIEIKRLLMDFHYQYNGRYPDDLDELNVDDSLFVYDQFGLEYF